MGKRAAFVIGLIVGLTVGWVVGILSAPQPGQETREAIGERAEEADVRVQG